ncbi:GDSL family lipase [Rhodococcus sp. 06-235-1A]|nr:GDSL family lipase [Rhodococcus sp. 06-235-1A]
MDRQWVASWAASPSDSASVVDSSLNPTFAVANQTFRMTVSPHLGGSTLRVHLSNRYRPIPLSFERATIAKQDSGASIKPDSLRELRFEGEQSATLAAGSDLVSDPVELDVEATEQLSISVYIPGLAVFPTEHFTGNTTSFYSPPGSGDHTNTISGTPLSSSTTTMLLASGVDVLAPGSTSSLVAFGDSITDGFVGSNYYLGFPQDPSVVDRNARYPDYLQRRIDSNDLPISVVNAGISGNRVIASGLIPQYSDSMVSRLQRDVIDKAGVRDVILLGGINDLGIPIGASFEQIIAGYTNIITRLRAADIAVHLGTLLPASNALLDGVLTVPLANPVRLQINEWIRTQTLADSVVDFDAALRDQRNPDVLDPRYAGPDNLHPNPAGYEAMANAVDLTAFSGRQCE